MRTITIANQKGGCGKTTVAINLSASLAREGRRTLLVDLDPQAHCALGMAVPEEQIDLSILDCLESRNEGRPLELSRITWQIAPNLDLAPSRSNLASIEPRLGAQEESDSLLRDLLEADATGYEYCVVDCPPYMGLLMRNGLHAADEVIIPVDTGYFSLHGLTQQLATIEQLGERRSVMPSVRVLANQYDVRTKLAREILAELRKRFPGVVYETIVNFNTKLKEGASFGQPITEFAPNSMGARDFQRLAREIMAGKPSRAHSADLLKHVERLTADAERLLATTTTLVGNQSSPAPGSAAPRKAALTPPGKVPEPVRATGNDIRAAGRSMAATSPPPGVPPLNSHEPIKTPAPPQEPAARTSESTSPPQPAPRPPSTSERMPVPAAPTRAEPAASTAMPPGRVMQPAAQPGAEATGRSAPQASAPARQAPAHTDVPRPLSEEAQSGKDTDRKIEAIYGIRQEGEVVIFRSHNPGAAEVQLAGDFNDWMPHTTPMRRLPNGDFETHLKLPKGRYRYRLVVDGRWSHDQNNPLVETNEYGELNSVVEVTR